MNSLTTTTNTPTASPAALKGHLRWAGELWEVTLEVDGMVIERVAVNKKLSLSQRLGRLLGSSSPDYIKVAYTSIFAIKETVKKHTEGFRLFVIEPSKSLEDSRSRIERQLLFETSIHAVDEVSIAQWISEITKRMEKANWWMEEKYDGKKLLVIVNPVAGTGKGKTVWPAVKRLFMLANLPFEVQFTNKAGHATQIVSNLKTESYFGIVCVSGDGLLTEVVNGVLAHTTVSQVVSDLFFGIIPAGSGNGLSACLDADDAITAVFAIIQGSTIPVDLISTSYNLKAEKPETVYGFLSLEWAALSHIDLESEGYRWLGPLRFDLKGAAEMMVNDCYKGSLTYLAAPKNSPDAPSQKLWKGAGGPPLSYLDPASRSSWTTCEDNEFTFFLASSGPKIQINNEGKHAQHASLSDGCIDLIYTPRVTRAENAQMLLAFDDGSYHDFDFVRYQKVKAFHLVTGSSPHDPTVTAPIAIDGERLNVDEILVEVHNAALKMFCTPGYNRKAEPVLPLPPLALTPSRSLRTSSYPYLRVNTPPSSPSFSA